VDWLIAELAERQHGVVERSQLRALGIRDARVKGRLRLGQLHPVHRGVYAVGHRILERNGRWMAAVLGCGPGAVLSHRSAAQLWQLTNRAPHAGEVTRASGWRAPAGVVVHRMTIPEDERTVVDGIPVTTVPRTILDLAAVASRRQVERAFNEAEVLGLTDPLSIPELLARYPRRRGTAMLRAVLADGERASGITRNDFEERFARFVDVHGLPPPRFNADIAVAGRFFNVDCVWDEARLVVELDGRATHGTRRAFEADRERDRLLVADGWRVVRITWRQLETPNGIVTDLRKLLAALPCGV
jgi:very-short-patch-repair endonuclease/predicted transcriptional regulator of viral defense system